MSFTADVSKAFLQLKVSEEGQDIQSFLWKDVCVPQTSNIYFSFLTIDPHVDELSKNLDVDDCISGCDDEKETCWMVKEV